MRKEAHMWDLAATLFLFLAVLLKLIDRPRCSAASGLASSACTWRARRRRGVAEVE